MGYDEFSRDSHESIFWGPFASYLSLSEQSGKRAIESFDNEFGLFANALEARWIMRKKLICPSVLKELGASDEDEIKRHYEMSRY